MLNRALFLLFQRYIFKQLVRTLSAVKNSQYINDTSSLLVDNLIISFNRFLALRVHLI